MDPSHLTLWKLEIFCQVLEQGSFSKAARALGVAQPTVSGHVADLERLFSTRLFDRGKGKIRPTRAGRLLFEQGRKLALLKEETVRGMANLLGLVEGDVVLGGSTIPGTYILPRHLAQFKAEHPAIRVTLKIGDSGEILAWLAEGEIELGVVGSRVQNADLKSDPYVDDELVLVLPAGHPLAAKKKVRPADLAGVPFLVREAGSGTRQRMDAALARAGGPTSERLAVVCELGSSESIKEAVRQGLGVSILSIHAVNHELEANGGLVARRLEGVDLRRTFHIVTHKKRTLSPIARVLADLLRAQKRR